MDALVLRQLVPPDCTKDADMCVEAARRIVYREGTIKDAMLSAGYLENQANLGMAGVPAFMKEIMSQIVLSDGKHLAKIGAKVDPNLVANTIKGRLYQNVVTGESAGEGSAKLLGSMKDYQLFQADSQVGVIVLASPNLQPAGKPLNVADSYDALDAEVEPMQLPDGKQ
jgi:hypothetical protein